MVIPRAPYLLETSLPGCSLLGMRERATLGVLRQRSAKGRFPYTWYTGLAEM